MNSLACSFPPLEGPVAHTLILGTMPGQASLQAKQYYAHARNAFWPIMMALIENKPVPDTYAHSLDYSIRCDRIMQNGYALWDVLASCERPGSLDSKIVRGSETANDIPELIKRHPELRCIACNGRTAERLFDKHIRPSLVQAVDNQAVNGGGNAADDAAGGASTLVCFDSQQIRLVSLPSTSPAMASLSLTRKHQLWADGLLG